MLDLFLPGGICFEAIEIARQAATRLGQTTDGLVEAVQQIAEPCIERRALAQQTERSCGLGLGAAGLGVVEQFEGGTGGLCEPSGVGEPGSLGRECGQFVGLQAERVEFAHHVTQQVEAIVAVARIVLALGERRGASEPLAMQARERGRERLAARISVEQAPLGRRLEQRLELVLTVDLGEQGADFAQSLYGDLMAIEVGARLAFTGDHAAHDELVVGLDALLGEPATHRGVGGA